MSENRIIKFRAWREAIDGVRPAYMAYQNEDGLGRFFDHVIDCAGDHIMQFTGLKDKNGKEIYEGDVVAISGIYDPETGQTETDLCEVKYEGPSLMYVNVDASDENSVESLIGVCPQDEDAEVIGNIYENPELIKP